MDGSKLYDVGPIAGVCHESSFLQADDFVNIDEYNIWLLYECQMQCILYYIVDWCAAVEWRHFATWILKNRIFCSVITASELFRMTLNRNRNWMDMDTYPGTLRVLVDTQKITKDRAIQLLCRSSI